MRNKHHLVFDSNVTICLKLFELGFTSTAQYAVADIYEDDPRWEAVKALMKRHRLAFDMPSTDFSDAELRAADWINIFGPWHFGYPQPEDTLFEYMPGTFDLTHFCYECGAGDIQIAPYRLKRAPKWGRRQIMMLNWVQDAYFVPPEAWETVFLPFGIECRPVLRYPSGSVLPNIVQLKIDHFLPGPLLLGDMAYEICPICHRKRYDGIECGYFPPMSCLPCDSHIAYSQEIFNGGKESFYETFISQALYQAIEAHHLKILKYTPVLQSPEG